MPSTAVLATPPANQKLRRVLSGSGGLATAAHPRRSVMSSGPRKAAWSSARRSSVEARSEPSGQ